MSPSFPSCTDFRRRLEAALAGRADPPGLAALGWHEHLAACGDCRELLEREEALEVLLASLPDPKLPPDLTRRVLAALRRRDAATRANPGTHLDALLALDEVDVPSGLSERVLESVARARLAANLDALLELVPAEPAPAGLAARVLAAARAEREAGARRWWTGGGGLRRAAAVLAIGLGAVAAWRAAGGATERSRIAAVDDAEVIALLPVLEYWDAIRELDPLEREIVTRLDVSDEALLDAEDS